MARLTLKDRKQLSDFRVCDCTAFQLLLQFRRQPVHFRIFVCLQPRVDDGLHHLIAHLPQGSACLSVSRRTGSAVPPAL